MFNARAFRIAASTALLAALAGCQAISPPPMRARIAPPPVQNSIDGEWINTTDQASYSRFFNGQVETIALDTGNILASGTYTRADPVNVSISMMSRIQGNLVEFNCLVVSPIQLNCTSAGGQQFSLTRRPSGIT